MNKLPVHFAPSRFLCAFALIPFFVLSAYGLAEDKPPPKPLDAQSLDAQLLDDLNADLLDGLPPLRPPAPSDKSPDKPADKAPAAGEDIGQPSDATHPLALVGEQMRAAQQRIAGRDTSPETQQLQQKIADDLAALVEQAKRQAAAGKPGKGSGQGSQAASTGGDPLPAPPNESTNRLEEGTKQQPETADVRSLIDRFWGHLPDKARDQMQSSLTEQFLPKYERLIEDYYQRLAEDHPNQP
ncbi:MAG: hypothetical protein WD872_03515 [Pirellulaceae bacterium]